MVGKNGESRQQVNRLDLLAVAGHQLEVGTEKPVGEPRMKRRIEAVDQVCVAEVQNPALNSRFDIMGENPLTS